MSEISIGEAVGEGFAVIRRQPLVVLAWGVVPLLFAAIYIALFLPLYLAMISEMARSVQSGGRPDPTAWMPQAMQSQGISYLLGAAGGLMNAVLSCAVIRSVLYPEQSRYAYLRVGKAELFLFLITIGAGIALAVGIVVLMIPVGIMIGVMAAMHAVGGAITVGVVAALALFVGLFYVVLRFSLVAPMMVAENDFRLMESWNMTRGKVGSLFCIGLLVVLVVLVAEVVVFGLVAAVGIAVLNASAGGLDGLPTLLKQHPGEILSKLAPVLVLYVLVAIPFSGFVLCVRAAPWARVYRQLHPTGDVAKTFT